MRFWLSMVFILIIPLQALTKTPLIWQETQIPMNTTTGQVKLEALLVFPDDKMKHPLALISHGTPRNVQDRYEMTALSYLPIAYEFARRGYSVAVVLRRGYGASEGGYVEYLGTYRNPQYLHTAQISSEDLRAAIKYLGTLKQFDTCNILAIGFSSGGLATIALSAFDPPDGLKAAINFAGGRGSYSNDNVARPDLLIAAFSEFGKTSRIPTLWIYAKNDHFFNPSLAKKMVMAFINNGGNATFIQANDFGKEGHFLFSSDGIPKWTPLVDKFLISQHLTLLNKLLPLPVSSLKAPDYLSHEAKQAFTHYKNNGPHKAFAVSSDGAFGWRAGKRSQKAAEKNALDICKKYTSKECKLIAVDDQAL